MTTPPHAERPERFDEAVRRFDEENARDPNREIDDGKEQPKELVYAGWLSAWVLRLCPEASEALRLAARCQHIARWEIPRASYPLTRPGYLQWREALKRHHAEKAGLILKEAGYPAEMIELVRGLILKRNFPRDPESRVLEDALCLVFLERQFASLAAKTGDDKLINAIRKSWKKMTPQARELALGLPSAPHERRLIEQALA